MTIWGDIRFSFRQLRKRPGLTLTVLITLALCIGVNTAIFSVIDAVFIRQLPYPEPERLGELGIQMRSSRGEQLKLNVDGIIWQSVHQNATKIDSAAIGSASGVNLFAGKRVEYVRQSRVSSGYFRVLGVLPRIGREFSAGEDTEGGATATVLGYKIWQRLFGGDPAVVGQTVHLRGEPFTVVGVMPEAFAPSEQVDLWTPLRPSTQGEGAGTNYHVLARIKPDVSWDEANAQLDTVERPILAAEHPNWHTHVELVPLQRGLTENVRAALLPTWGAALVILLIGCVNVAGLLLAQSASRRREIATRMAVGGSRGRIISQLLIDSMLLALIGGGIGIAVAILTINAFRHLGMEGFNLWRPVTLDLRILLIATGASLVTSLIFGLLPAFDTTRLDVRSVLLEGSRSTTNAGQRRMRQLLVAGQIALGLLLLVCAGLLAETLEHLQHLDPGFNSRHVLAAQLSLQDARYKTSASVNAFLQKGLDRIRSLPGVESAAVGLSLPYQRPLNTGVRVVDGRDQSEDFAAVDIIFVTPGYFETLGMSVLSGRSFNGRDSADSQAVAIVNKAFASRYLSHSDLLGSHVTFETQTVSIVGTVPDTPQSSGAIDDGPPLAPSPTIYVPYSQVGDKGLLMIHTWISPAWIVRTRAVDPNLPREMEKMIQSIDPLLPFSTFSSMEELQQASLTNQRYRAALFAIFAGLALMLAAVGLYGLVANSVSQRTQEIGIRMALGSSVRDAMIAVIVPGLIMALVGVVTGLALSWFAVELLRTMIWEVPTRDPSTFAGAAVIMLVISLVAGTLPALRLTRLDPAQSLRNN